jgi:hypothetical protein
LFLARISSTNEAKIVVEDCGRKHVERREWGVGREMDDDDDDDDDGCGGEWEGRRLVERVRRAVAVRRDGRVGRKEGVVGNEGNLNLVPFVLLKKLGGKIDSNQEDILD